MRYKISQEKISQRNTWKRDAILAVLNGESKPISADYIHDMLKSQNKQINLSTVYRTLNVLESKRLIHSFSPKNSKRALFTVHGKSCNTHVMICRKCGREDIVTDCPIEEIKKVAFRDNEFIIECHHLELRGICGACSSKNTEAIK